MKKNKTGDLDGSVDYGHGRPYHGRWSAGRRADRISGGVAGCIEDCSSLRGLWRSGCCSAHAAWPILSTPPGGFRRRSPKRKTPRNRKRTNPRARRRPGRRTGTRCARRCRTGCSPITKTPAIPIDRYRARANSSARRPGLRPRPRARRRTGGRRCGESSGRRGRSAESRVSCLRGGRAGLSASAKPCSFAADDDSAPWPGWRRAGKPVEP